MKNNLWTLAGALALLAMLGHFYAKPLLAQVRAALVQNIDEPGRHPYQATVILDSAVNPFPFFPDVPVGQRLVIEQIMVQAASPNYGAFRLIVGFNVVFEGDLSTGLRSPGI